MLADLLDLVLPRDCAGCSAPGRTLCQACAQALRRVPLWAGPDPAPPGLPAVTAAAGYDGVVRSLLIAHKERGRTALAAPLGRALAAAVALHEPGREVLLVPVPSAPAAVRARGHDHARRLAAVAARRLGLRCAAALVQGRPVADQVGLGVAARASNLGGALRARHRLDELEVLVVDDLITTGATLTEAGRALSVAGARVTGAAVVAATARAALRGAAHHPAPPRV